jgi:hypothetical protein|tara:strand:+ start:6726 stop:7637 length:912 start_codon:yes stop_codon:yes gene_type:complete
MSSLSPGELFKYDWRREIFLKKYKNKEPFDLVDGSKKVFIPNKEIIGIVERGVNPSALTKLGLVTSDGNIYAFSKLEKTKEFGGKGAGFGTTKEDIELTSLQEQILALKSKLKSATVPIRVGNKTYNIAGAASTPGTPKSDFHLVDNDGKECVWISHKDGRSAKDIQQWGGMTEAAIKNLPEIKKFAKDVFDKFDGVIPRATTVARKIKDSGLKNLSVYGVDYGKSLGQQNVSILIQGPVKLILFGKSYKFASNNIHLNGDSITGEFEPVLMAMYKGDRNNFNVRGARFAIQGIGSRKITEMI